MGLFEAGVEARCHVVLMYDEHVASLTACFLDRRAPEVTRVRGYSLGSTRASQAVWKPLSVSGGARMLQRVSRRSPPVSPCIDLVTS